MRLETAWRGLCSLLLLSMALGFPMAHADEGKTDDEPVPYELDANEQGLFEDINEPLPSTEEGGKPPPPDVRYLNLNAKITLDYYFYGGQNKLTLTYYLEARSKINLPSAEAMQAPDAKPYQVDLKGTAEMYTKVSGYLAQGPGIECALDIDVGNIPFDIKYHQTDAEHVTVSLMSLGPSTESWASHCSFADDPEAAFNTSGPPETWVNLFLSGIREQLKTVEMTIASYDTEVDFRIEPISAEDEDIGSVEMYGEGFIQIEAAQPPAATTVAKEIR